MVFDLERENEGFREVFSSRDCSVITTVTNFLLLNLGKVEGREAHGGTVEGPNDIVKNRWAGVFLCFWAFNGLCMTT